MRKSAFAGLAIAATLVVLPAETFAQRGGGGGRGGAGGGMCAGGMGSGGIAGSMVTRTGRGMRMGTGGQMTGGTISSLATLSQLNRMALTQRGAGRGGSGDTAGRRSQPRPTAGRFTRAAMRFDQNDDGQLDEEELRLVASAVMTELRSSRRGRPTAVPSRTGRTGIADRTGPAGQTSGTNTNQKQQTFVNRAMDFDRNGDGMLNQSETSRMARALIRSLG